MIARPVLPDCPESLGEEFVNSVSDGAGLAVNGSVTLETRRPKPSTSLSFAFAVALLSGSCASAPRAGSTGEVEIVVQGFVDAVNSADLDGVLAFFASDASVFLPSADSPDRLTGVAAIRKGMASAFESKPRNTMAVRDLVITVDGRIAVASFEIGNPIVHSRRTLVLRRIGAKWEIIHLHGSNLRAEGR